LEFNDFGDFESVTTKNEVTHLSGEKSQKSKGCDGVSDKYPPKGVSRESSAFGDASDNDPFATLKNPNLRLQPREED
jgi:hypothetical protein